VKTSRLRYHIEIKETLLQTLVSIGMRIVSM
jgi:hypothetical protein